MAGVPVIALVLAACTGGLPTGDTDPGRDTGAPTIGPDTAPPTAASPHVWVKVDTAPCALDAEGYVYCWTSSTWEGGGLFGDAWERDRGSQPMPVNLHPMDDLRAPDTSPVVGRRVADGAPEVWHCHSGSQQSGWCNPPSVAGALAGQACLLRPDGEILYWWQGEASPVSELFPDSGPFVLADGDGRLCAGVMASGRAVVTDDEFPMFEGTFTLPVSSFVAVAQAACALHPNGAVTCLPNPDARESWPPSPTFDNPPYQRLVAGGVTVCAQRLIDHVIECDDGQTFDFGPIRQMAARSFDSIGHSQWSAANSVSASVCVITESNEIRCEGTRFPPDLRTLPPAGWTAPAPGQYPPPP